MANNPHPHVVVCLDEDERTTRISGHRLYASAESKLKKLESEYPNGDFDIWDACDTVGLGYTEVDWNV